MNHSDSIGKLAEALSKAQGAFTHVGKDGKSHHGKYATLPAVLDVVRAPLAENGLSIVQAPSSEGNVVTVTTRIMHVSGEWLETSISSTAQANIQQLGSAVSYLRRYSLMAVLALAADDDDDGNTAMQAPQQPRPAPRPAPTPAPAKLAQGPTLSPERAAGFEKWLTATLGNTEEANTTPYDYAAKTLGLPKLSDFTELTMSEVKKVQSAAEALPKTA